MLPHAEVTRRLAADRRSEPRPLPTGHPLSPLLAAAFDVQLGNSGALAKALDELPAAELGELVMLLEPQLGRDLLAAWVLRIQMPYLDERPFRVPARSWTRWQRFTDLRTVLAATRLYERDLPWFARWAGYLHDGQPEAFGVLLAARIAGGDTALRDLLIEIARGRDEVASLSPHVVTALLACPDPVAWDAVTDLLVKAQRQEGVRELVLAHAHLAPPAGFRRIVEVILEHGMTRFVTVVRAASTWLGESYEVRQDKLLTAHLETFASYLDDPPRGESLAAVTRRGAADTYLALCALGVHGVAPHETPGLLASPDPEVRLATARFVDTAGLLPQKALTPLLLDVDPRVAAFVVGRYAVDVDGYGGGASWLTTEEIDNLLLAMERFERPVTYEVGVLTSRTVPIQRSSAADALIAFTRDIRDPRLHAAFQRAGVAGRIRRARRLADEPGTYRTELVHSLGDASSRIRQIALDALHRSVSDVAADEALALERLLDRSGSGLRPRTMDLLKRQSPEALAATIARLGAGTERQQSVGRELGGLPTTAVEALPLAPSRGVEALLDVDDTRRTPAVRPPAPPVPDGQAERCELVVRSLLACFDEHADVDVDGGWGPVALKNLSQWIRTPEGELMPFPEVFGPWWAEVEPQLTDGGVELLLVAELYGHLLVPQGMDSLRWTAPVVAKLIGPRCAELQRWRLAPHLLNGLAAKVRRPSWRRHELDVSTSLLAALPEAYFTAEELVTWVGRPQRFGGRKPPPDPRIWIQRWLPGVRSRRFESPLERDGLQEAWALARYADEPAGTHVRGRDPEVPDRARAAQLGVPLEHPLAAIPLQARRWHPSARFAVAAYEAGVATEEDMVDFLLGQGEALQILTRRAPEEWVGQATRTAELVDRVCVALLSRELHRGEFATPTSGLMRRVRRIEGIPVLTSYLTALGPEPFARGYSRDGRSGALSSVVRRVTPTPEDTPEAFAAAVRTSGLDERRMVELGHYAPQWAAHVQHVLGWPGYEDAAWWIHAHSKGADWSVDEEIRSEWRVAISQRTAVGADDLVRGAVDVDWFHRLHSVLTDERFDAILRAAKYASSSTGHNRATLFAEVLRGRVTPDQLRDRIRAKRHQDSVRALGLAPLPDQGRDDEILERYRLLRSFVATDRTSGSVRRTAEREAVEVGLENLARTAGYRDPQRLGWAIESHAIADLAAGPVTAVHGDLTVTLSVQADGSPDLDVRRGARRLANIPKASAKVPEILALKERRAELGDQVVRMRQSLERSCVSGDAIALDELAGMLRHPVLRPMLRDLLLIGSDGTLGFTGEEAGRLIGADGAIRKATGPFCVAHPVDLLATGQWPEFQRVLFEQERRQPFRQLFRELYTLTDNERQTPTTSRRYAGHQVEPRRARALLTAREWVVDFESGFTKTFHAERLTAWVDFPWVDGSPAMGSEPSIESVSFAPQVRTGPGRRATWDDVPPRVFSEVMRDLDLVVSVAHAAGVDPESSESTIEMRARLVRETAQLLGLQVEMFEPFVRVTGARAKYSVHLGSGVVHRQPGGALCLVPVPDQQRGRIFLPFVDDDPRTAEILSKVILLACDDTILDPAIVAQISG